MQILLAIILSCIVPTYAFPIPKTENVTEEMKLVETYLDSGSPQTLPRTYLQSEDKLDSSTPALLKKPKCGVSNVGAFSVFPGTPTWHKRDITYKIVNYTSDMAAAEVDEVFKKAFSLWSSVSCLNFTMVSNNADIEISFYFTGPHTPFPEDILGYAYGPGPGAGGNMYLNEAMLWTINYYEILRNEAISLFLAAVHELGHILGLAHSTQLGAVMFADYTPTDYKYLKYIAKDLPDFESLTFHQDDIDGIQHLYGITCTPSV